MSIDRLKKQFGLSQEKAQKGVWITIDLGDGGAPFKFLLARYGRNNRKWAAKADLYYRQNKRRVDANLVPPEEERQAFMKFFVEAVLLDWEGVADTDDRPIPYSSEAALKLFAGCGGLYEYLLEESQDIVNFQDQETEKIAGESVPTSSGN